MGSEFIPFGYTAGYKFDWIVTSVKFRKGKGEYIIIWTKKQCYVVWEKSDDDDIDLKSLGSGDYN